MEVDTGHVGAAQQCAEPVAPVPTPPQQPLAPQVLPAGPVQLTPEMIQELLKSGQLVIPSTPLAAEVATQPAQPVPPAQPLEVLQEQRLEVRGEPAQPVPPKGALVAEGQPDQRPDQRPAQPVPPKQPLEVQGEPTQPVPPREPLVPAAGQPDQQPAQPALLQEAQGQPAQPLEVGIQVPVPPKQPAEVQPLAAVPQPAKPTKQPEEPQIADAELAAMGWKVEKSCRPQASPQSSPAASPPQVEATDLQRLKSQVFSENDGAKTGAVSQKPDGAPAASQTHKVQQFNQAPIRAPPMQIVQVPTPNLQTKEQQEYSRLWISLTVKWYPVWLNVAEGKISVRTAAEFGGNLTKDGCSKACQCFCVCCTQ
eukprot:s4366_g1.t1